MPFVCHMIASSLNIQTSPPHYVLHKKCSLSEKSIYYGYAPSLAGIMHSHDSALCDSTPDQATTG